MASTKSVAGAGYGNPYVDSLIWGGPVWDTKSGPITYSFAGPDDYYARYFHRGFLDFSIWDKLDRWSAKEKGAFQAVMDLYAGVCKVTFGEATSAPDANLVWWQKSVDGAYGVHETPSSQSWGFFNYEITPSWGAFDVGGHGRKTIIHELGHALGLAHPHDGGTRADATTFPGVAADADDDLGTGKLNQTIWTVMSYNDGHDPDPVTDIYGNQGGLGALDIAALQELYGANMDTRTGDDVYRLPAGNRAGTGWSCIWDAGGTDTISAAGLAKGVDIDLRPATLRSGKGTGGFISAAHDVSGGFTIAHGVVIENAVGSSKADRITGNSHANRIDGRGGADRMDGLGGDDTYVVDNRSDTVADTGGGRDTVLARTSYALGATSSVEVLQAFDLDGTAALKLTGNGAANTITGNAGKNILDGGAGRDVLTGGLGRDQFLFDTKLQRTNVDHILDFSVTDDTIRLDRSIFGAFKKTGVLKDAAFHVAASGHLAHDASDRIIYDESSGSLYYDPDGTGHKGATLFAILESGLALTARDFYIA